MLMLVSMQTMATDVFTSNRTDFRDESIYFMMTTRFYDGDPSNNVLCWDNQEAQKSTKDPCWRGDFQGVIDKLDYIKALGFTAIWITPYFLVLGSKASRRPSPSRLRLSTIRQIVSAGNTSLYG